MAVISSCSSSNPVASIKFVHEFHNVTSHYCQALNSVIPIFTYMVSSIVANDFNRIPRNFIMLKDIALKIDNLKLQNFIESILCGKQASNKSKG